MKKLAKCPNNNRKILRKNLSYYAHFVGECLFPEHEHVQVFWLVGMPQ